jgi:hypothetical protein
MISLSFSAFCFAFLAFDKAAAEFAAGLSPQLVMVVLASTKISSNSASIAQIMSTRCSPKRATIGDGIGGLEEEEGSPFRTDWINEMNAVADIVCLGDQVLNMDKMRV